MANNKKNPVAVKPAAGLGGAVDRLTTIAERLEKIATRPADNERLIAAWANVADELTQKIVGEVENVLGVSLKESPVLVQRIRRVILAAGGDRA